MFFTRIGKIVSHLMFWFAVMHVALGFFGAITTPNMASNRAFATNYLSAETTGEAINKGMIYLLLALALGVLCEISAKRSKTDERA